MELLELHKKMYDVRWNGVKGDLEQLEKEFVALAEHNGMDLEKVNEMLEQLYIPPYKTDMLPNHLKSNNHGGKREGAGRPSLGITKKVSLTLGDETWEKIDEDKEKKDITQSALLRDIIENHYNSKE